MYNTFETKSKVFYAVRTQSFTVEIVSLVETTVSPAYVPAYVPEYVREPE